MPFSGSRATTYGSRKVSSAGRDSVMRLVIRGRVEMRSI